MSSLHTFYLAPSSWQEPFILQGQEAHHLLKVLRMRPGQKLRLIDGCGHWGIFTLKDQDKKQAFLRPECQNFDPPPPYPLILALAWNKALRRSFVLEKAVELGATGIWFWTGQHSQGQPGGHTSWQRSLIAAAKQCGATWLPEIRVWPHLKALITASTHCGTKILCWEQAPPQALIDHALLDTQGTLVAIGPEGGLAKTEVQEMQNAGFQVVSLGSSILRFETAALFVLSMHYWALTRQNLQDHDQGHDPGLDK